MLKFIKFIDTATTDEHAMPADKVNLIEVTDNNTVKIFTQNSGDEADNVVEITCVGTTNATTVCDFIIKKVANNRQAITEVSAASHSKITTVAYSAGA